MKKHLKNAVLLPLIAYFLFACGGAQKEAREESRSSESNREQIQREEAEEATNSNENKKKSATNKDEVSEAEVAANMNLDKTGRKFIRTGELKARVKDVMKTTTQIEDLTAKYEGFITYTNLYNSSYTTDKILSADSVQKSIVYTTHNEFILRIPNQKLDSFLRAIRTELAFIEFRILKAEDVSFAELNNQLAKERLEQYQKDQNKAIKEDKNKNLNDVSQVNKDKLDAQAQKDNTTLSQAQINDQVAYSTLKMHIYQYEKVKSEVIFYARSLSDYRPSYSYRLSKALEQGWLFLGDFVIGLLYFWPFILLFGFSVVLYRSWRGSRKRRKKSDD